MAKELRRIASCSLSSRGFIYGCFFLFHVYDVAAVSGTYLTSRCQAPLGRAFAVWQYSRAKLHKFPRSAKSLFSLGVSGRCNTLPGNSSAKRSEAHLRKQPSDISNTDDVSTSAEIHSQRRCQSYIQRKLRRYATFCKHNNPSFALRKEGSATPATDGRR